MSSDPDISVSAPPTSSFCVELNKPPEGAGVIRFFGGLSLSAVGDPTRGPAGSCATTLDLVGGIQSALAPLSPVLKILDAVSAIGQAFLLLTEAITNPLKLLELLKLIPSLVAKLNSLLALVPVFPQGVLSILEMCLDILNFILTQIDCLLEILRSMQTSIDDLNRLIVGINEVDDVEIRGGLEEAFACGMQNSEQQMMEALKVFGPLARIMCTVRTLVALVPGGAEVAKKIGIPELSDIPDLSGVIRAVSTIRDVISEVVQIVTILGAPLGLQLPELGFSCPPLSDTESPSQEAAPQPVLDLILDSATGLPITALSVVAPDAVGLAIELRGFGFTEDSQVYWTTSPLSAVAFDPVTLCLRAVVPATLRATPGDAYVAVVNTPANLAAPFMGLASPDGATSDNGVRVSAQYPITLS